MVAFKKHILKISLLLILLSAVFLCVYTIWNYHSNTAPTQSRTRPHNSLSSERNRLPDIPNQTPRGQFTKLNSTQHMAPPNGRMWGGIASAGTKYAPQLISYSIIFLFAFIAAYYIFIYKKVNIHPGHERVLILTLLCVGLLLRISSSTLMDGHPFDINTFKSWATTAANNLFQVYSNSRSSDYPPLYIYILLIIGKIASVPAMSPYFTLLLQKIFRSGLNSR